MIKKIDDGVYTMDIKTYMKISEMERKQIEIYKNNYLYHKIEKTNEELQKLNKKSEDHGNCIVITACLVFINLILTIITLSMATSLYEEFMPKECNCNNTLVIDTDTLTP